MSDYRPYGRPGRGRIWARRLVATVAVAALVVAGAWFGVSLVSADEPPPPPPTQPPLARLNIIFPEGFTRKEMAGRVDAVRKIAIDKRSVTPRITQAGYLAASAAAKPPAAFRKDWGGKSIEGFLFPATYEFTKLTTSQRLVADQLEYFGEQWAKVDMRYARSKKLTPYDVLKIASMIEKETVVPRERPLVSAVIYNRLKAGMVLGIDATIRYGRNVPGTEPLKLSDIETLHPYNSRKVAGLPPTPISNPGLASLRAAANPARVGYLYFVRKGESNEHFFTASEAEFCQKSLEYGFGGC